MEIHQVESKNDIDTPLIEQAINENLEFRHDSYDALIKKSNFSSQGLNYYSVFILGSQSTGKSTLLNALFDTNFDVMVAQQGPTQTTQGVWMGISNKPAKTILVFDVEGTDAGERGEMHVVFERKTSLFSLALSQILILNLMASDVGHFEGANMGLLRAVFELNLQLFQDSITNRKLLFFILRDHDGSRPLEKLAARVMDDLQKLWNNSVQKPEKYQSSKIEDFFDIEIVSLPHLIFQREKWYEEVKLLRDRFENEANPRYVLNSSYKTDIPSDGFPAYAEKIWDTIVHDKDLDLPSQKQMLAIFRCDEIKKEAFLKIDDQLKELHTKIVENREILENFGMQSKEIIQSCLQEYQKNALRYDKKIAADKANELEKEIFVILKEIFHVQQKLIIAHCTAYINEQAGLRISKNEFRSDLMSIVQQLRDETMKIFKNLMDSSIVPGSNWDYTRELDEIAANIKTSVETMKEVQLKIWNAKLKEDVKRKLVNLLRPALEKADPSNMWILIGDNYNDQVQNSFLEINKILNQFEYSEEEKAKKLQLQGDVFYSLLKDIIQEKANNVDLMMVARFKKAFLEDETGTPVSWAYNDDLIAPWKKAKINAEMLLDLFSVIRLPDPKSEEGDSLKYKYCFFQPSFENGEVVLLDNPPDLPEDRVIITPVQGQRILEVFRQSAFTHYQMALKDKEHANASAAIPKQFLLLLLILGANEIWYVASMLLFNPLGLVFLVFIGISAFIIFKLNLYPVIYSGVTMGVKHLAAQYAPTALYATNTTTTKRNTAVVDDGERSSIEKKEKKEKIL